MNVLSVFNKSNAWDNDFNLPLVPFHNNPHIYMAYAVKIMKYYNSGLAHDELREPYTSFVNRCKIENGLFYRWPKDNPRKTHDGKPILGGPFSYDEIIGMAYLSNKLCIQLYYYLKWKWGYYDNGEDPHLKFRFFRLNQYRFVFLMPYLKCRMGMPLNIFDKLFIKMHLKLNALKHPQGNEGGILRTWIMCEHFEKQMPNEVNLWRNKMTEIGYTPKHCFSFYLSECPVYYTYAPKHFSTHKKMP